MPEALELRAGREQVGVCSLCDECSIFEHENSISALEKDAALRDSQAGKITPLREALPECLLRLDIEGAGEIIKEQEVRVMDKHIRAATRCTCPLERRTPRGSMTIFQNYQIVGPA